MAKFNYNGQDQMIRDLHLTHSVEQERLFIADQLAAMRTQIKGCTERERALILARLIFFNIKGYNTAFAHVEILTLMGHQNLSYKRIGYLAAATLLDASNDIEILLPQTVMKDLQSSNLNFVSLALRLIANLKNVELCRVTASTVLSLFGHADFRIKKFAGMAALTIIRTDHQHIEAFRASIATLLNCTTHSIILVGIHLCVYIIHCTPSIRKPWKGFLAPFIRVLETLTDNQATRDYDFHGFNDPFLQIKTLQVISLFETPSDHLDDILTKILTTLDSRRNTCRTLLIQVSTAIARCGKKASLKALAINQIGRLFNTKTALGSYAALSAFSRFLFNKRGEIIDRSSADSQALQRYKTQIVECFNHPDPSLRKKALEVIIALVNEENVETLVPEIMNYIKLVDSDFKGEIVPKLFQVIQRFAPNPEWNFNMILKLLLECENQISSDMIVAFCHLLARNSELQDYSLQKLPGLLEMNISNQPLIRVSTFIIGEYFNNEDTLLKPYLDSMKKIIKIPQTLPETQLYILTSIAKLGIRYPQIFNEDNSIEEYKNIKDFFNSFEDNNNLEIQQRAGEFARLFGKKDLAVSCLQPLIDEKDQKKSKSAKTRTRASSLKSRKRNDSLSKKTGKTDKGSDKEDAKAKVKKPSVPKGNKTKKPASKSPEKAKEKVEDEGDLLLDLSDDEPQSQPELSLPASPQSSSANLAQEEEKLKIVDEPVITPPVGAVEAMKTNDYVVYFEIQRNQSNMNQMAIRVSIFGLGKVELTKFLMQFAVPNGWQLRTQGPPSSDVLLPLGANKPIQHVLFLQNNGNHPLIMLTQTNYMYRTQPIKENGQINPIF